MDVRVKHKKTGVEKILPLKVYNQVKAKYKLLGEVVEEGSEKKAQVLAPTLKVATKEEEKPVKVAEEVKKNPSEELEALQKQYVELTGEDPGKKTAKTLKKEIAEMTTPAPNED